MAKITLVKPQTFRLRSGSRRFNIYLDGEFAFGADEDLIVERRLIVGKLLTASDVEQLLNEVEVGKLMERMYRLFNIRQRSEKEVRDYLKNLSFKRKVKGQEEISSYIIDVIVQALKRKGLLNDEEFARAWVEGRRRSKKKGKIALKQELFQKGIDRDIVNELFSNSAIEQLSEEDLASQALERKLNSWKVLEPLDFKKKANGFLQRKGFEFEVVNKIVENTIKELYNKK